MSGHHGHGRESSGREDMAYVQGESLKVMLPSLYGFQLPALAPSARLP